MLRHQPETPLSLEVCSGAMLGEGYSGQILSTMFNFEKYGSVTVS